jgi:hypothetical protein
MSLESEVKRIADTLDELLAIAKKENVISTEKPKKKPAVAATEDIMPGAEDAAPGADNAGAPGKEEKIKTAADLRELAQKYIQAAGDNTGTLVKFIQSVAKIFNPAEPKLIKIPVEKVAEAAKMIEDWCKKQKITLPIEV